MDLRDYISKCEAEGQLMRVKAEVDWDLELSTLSKMNEEKGGPALLFEKVKGYTSPVLTCAFGNARRFGICLGMPEEYSFCDMTREWMNLSVKEPIAAKQVATGPVTENVVEGNNIDLLKMFPVPRFYLLDGGRYIGTTEFLCIKDPDDGKINLGTYRMQVLDNKSIGVNITLGKKGDRIMNKYKKMGKKMPGAVVIGCDPLLMMTGASMYKAASDYDVASSIRGSAIEYFNSDLTDLPLPADAEIILEGEIDPTKLREEGPFGEYTGYYSEETDRPFPKPALDVKRVMHRNNPILWASAAGRPITDAHMLLAFTRTATLWTELVKMKIPGIKSVWCPPETCGRFWAIVSVQQKYPGHPDQVLNAVCASNTASYGVKGVIVVDEDISADDLARVWWALSVRYMPHRGTTILQRGRSTPWDPALGQFTTITSRILMDATIPFEWKVKPKEVRLPDDVVEKVKSRWKEYGFDTHHT